MPTVWGGEGEGGSAVDFSKARQGLQASNVKSQKQKEERRRRA